MLILVPLFEKHGSVRCGYKLATSKEVFGVARNEHQRVQRISFRLFETEVELLRLVSEAEGIRPSDLARDLAVDGLLDKVVRMDPETPKEL